MEPVVSVLLPAFDAGATLAVALRSVARQREARLECVVVDDGSRDATRAIAERRAAADPRFRVIAAPHEGLVAALQRGLAACRAPVVARMDADDWMHHDRLAAQCAALAHGDVVAVGCHVRLFPRRGMSDGLRAYEAWLNAIATPEDVAREAYVECPIAHPTLCIRREALATHGYRDAGWPEDYDLLLRLLADGARIGVVPRRLHGWRDGPARLSRTSPDYAQERFTACKASFLASGLLAQCSDYVLWGYGGTGRALRRALAERGRRPACIVELHPGRLGQRIHGAPVVAPEALRGMRGRPVVVSVAGARARAEIRAALADLGFAEGRDFVCAA